MTDIITLAQATHDRIRDALTRAGRMDRVYFAAVSKTRMLFIVQGNSPENGISPGSKLILNADTLSQTLGNENIIIW